MKTISTQKILFCLLFILSAFLLKAQDGLENVIVEKYYISDATDAEGSIGDLPPGSVTYRIYVDMLPGYKYLDAFGDNLHPLKITTTTSFFNNEDRGNVIPTFTKAQVSKNTVMLDSWLSAGAACEDYFGILKSDDDSIGTIENADGILKNSDPEAGIPLTLQDGFIAGSPASCSTIGIDSVSSIFDATSNSGNEFIVTEGAWYCLEGATGPKDDNKVLIAQITTNGQLHFELNILIGTTDGEGEVYVPKDPEFYNDKMEIQKDFLTWTSPLINSISKVETNKPVISIYPNPVKNALSLKIDLLSNNSDNSFSIYDITGNLMMTKKIQNNTGNYYENIDMRTFTNGIYLMEISLNGNKSLKKIIVNK